MLSVVIPAYNESRNIEITVNAIYEALNAEDISHEILVVNDHSRDDTESILKVMCENVLTLKYVNNTGKGGFGNAIRFGLEVFKGDYVAIMMADLSDSPHDLISFYKLAVKEKKDAVFGSRFIKGGSVSDYPKHKYILNRFFNNLVRYLFASSYNDFTNAFKIYKKETIYGLRPFLSHHFNLTLELPLKVLVRGYTFEVLPNSWKNRQYGTSNLKIKEMGGRYFFILFYCLIEKYFSRGDYHKKRIKN